MRRKRRTDVHLRVAVNCNQSDCYDDSITKFLFVDFCGETRNGFLVITVVMILFIG